MAQRRNPKGSSKGGQFASGKSGVAPPTSARSVPVTCGEEQILREVRAVRNDVAAMHEKFRELAGGNQPTRTRGETGSWEEFYAQVREEFDNIPERPQREPSRDEIRALENHGMGPTEQDKLIAAKAANRGKWSSVEDARKIVYVTVYRREQRSARMGRRSPRPMTEIAPIFFESDGGGE